MVLSGARRTEPGKDINRTKVKVGRLLGSRCQAQLSKTKGSHRWELLWAG